MRKQICLLTLALAALAHNANAFTIAIDYTYDTSGFFATNLTAKAALEAAATDLSAVITSDLTAVTPSSMAYTGTNGATSATVDWKLFFDHPTTGVTTELTSFSGATTNTYTIFAGVRPLSAITLGQGGPSGDEFTLSAGGSPSLIAGAVSAMETASNSGMRRGSSGPIVRNYAGSLSFGNTSVPYSLNTGLVAGVITFDNDANNDGFVDLDLSTYWHFDHTTSVAFGKNDFYSVALHEILHSLGVGASETWDSLTDNTTWLGSAGIAANGGSGSGLIAGSGDHIASSTLSTTFVGGDVQEAAMDPTLTTGSRKRLTVLDAAILQDLGFAIIPEPSTYALALGAVTLVGVIAIRRRRQS